MQNVEDGLNQKLDRLAEEMPQEVAERLVQSVRSHLFGPAKPSSRLALLPGGLVFWREFQEVTGLGLDPAEMTYLERCERQAPGDTVLRAIQRLASRRTHEGLGMCSSDPLVSLAEYITLYL